ncbi:MAG TPA: hypothetical protein VHZ50_08945 [Puia sp.]|jgi:hypothetical protein|nr:hypothetical protein [Puia sp.]
MRNIIILFSSLFIIVSSCKRHLSREQTEMELKITMEKYLNASRSVDTAKPKFIVHSVIFFEDKVFFDCQFKVEMKQSGKDTVGDMAAWISKDFTKVKRKY